MKYRKKMNPANQKIYKDIIKAVEVAKSILIASHEDPDGDSIGSQLAMRQFAIAKGKSVTILNHGAIPDKYLFLPNIVEIKNIEDYQGSESFDLAIIIECPGLERLGKVQRHLGEGTKLINIDHHPDNQKFGVVNLLNSKASSVGEMLVEYFEAINWKIDTNAAICLYAAILTDTGRFRYNSTTRRTMEIAGQLIELGANPREICDRIYYTMPLQLIKLTGTALSGINFYEDGRICLMQVDRRMLEENKTDYGDLNGLADYTLFGKGVVVGGLIKELDKGRTKVSLRSRGKFDVSSVAHKYGGGGHFNAAGFAVNLPMDAVRKTLLKDLIEALNGQL